MTKPDESVYPWYVPIDCENSGEVGLSKRELFAIELFKATVQADLTYGDSLNSMRSKGLNLYAKFAIECADTLIEELNHEPAN